MSRIKNRSGQYTVRWYSAEEKEKLLCALDRMGFNVSGAERLPEYQYTEHAPNSYTVEFGGTRSFWPVQPFIGAAMISCGARIYMVDEFIRLMDLDVDHHPRFPVFHVPHDGHEFPRELMESVWVSGGEFLRYHLKMSDKDVAKVLPGVYRFYSHRQQFGISRLLCDVERFADEREPMERYGMGFCYEKAYDGTKLRYVSDETRKKTLRYYEQHHQKMNELCKRHPKMLLIDLHSYSEETVQAGQKEAGRNMPDLCIGTDEKYTPPVLTKIVRSAFSAAGYSTDLNYPYTGTFVPHVVLDGGSDCDCVSIMLELNKRTYLLEDGRPDEAGIMKIRKVIGKIMVECLELP